MPAAALAATALTIVSANVGNINGACADAKFKLCQPAVEARAADAIQAIRPDVIGLIEVLPDGRQAERLVGAGYAISCDERFGWDCLAVRKGSGVRVVKRLQTRRALGDCDPGFTLNTGVLRYRHKRIALVLAHPDSSTTDPTCRRDQVSDVFARVATSGRVLALGDWNLDPYREKDASVTAFKAARTYLGLRLASGKAFTLMAGSSMTDPTGERLDDGTTTIPYPFSERTIDHVLTRRLGGSCRVRRVDGGGGMDHRAQVCKLRVRR